MQVEKNKSVLIISMNKYWMGISRLPSALSRAGFTTYALCPIGSYISFTKFLNSSITYPTFTYTRSRIFYIPLMYSLIKYRPDIILPGDEEALSALQNFSNALSNLPFFSRYSKLINKSLADRKFDKVLMTKSSFIEKCVEWGIRAPANILVKSEKEAIDAALKLNYPVVLKIDGGYGGSGVFICQNVSELIKNFSASNGFSVTKFLKSFLKSLFFINATDSTQSISLQQFVPGITGHLPFCALNGKLLGSNPMLKLKTYPGSTGPTSVSCGFNNKEIVQFAETAVEKMSYTGFGALDFIVEEATNKLFIIELNPRPTPSCHFSSSLVANDLCGIFFKAIHHLPFQESPYKDFTVAMFPNETKRDPKSPYLTEAHHDIPLDDPKLLNILKENI